jgi:hypothetical protein
MKEEAPLGNPITREPRSDRPAMDGAGRLAHVAIAPPLCPKGVVVELKRGIVEGEGGRPAIKWLTIHAGPPPNSYFHPLSYPVPRKRE